MQARGTLRLLLLAAVLAATSAARMSPHLDASQMRAAVAGGRHDFAGADLAHDDLTGLDLTGAKLAGADLTGATLHGVRLLGADLTGAKLVDADLTFAWIMRADFSRADLRGAVLQTVVTSIGMDNTPEQAARFVGADLSDASITVHFSFDDMRAARFTHAHMSVVMVNQSMGLLRSEFIGADLDGAVFDGAGLGHVSFRFARLRGATFRKADLSDADFDGAYLDGADFTGARIQHTSFSGASVPGVKGLAAAP